MTDQDRGAYTPQTDEPLTFDARRPSERRPIPMTLIGSAVVLVALIAGVALVYRGGVRSAGDAPRPVGSPVMSVKTAPAPVPVEVRNTMAASDLYAASKPDNTVAAAAAGPAQTATPPVAGSPTQTVVAAAPAVATTGPAPTFAAGPETVAPRPKPKRSTLAMLAPPPGPRPAVVHPVRPMVVAHTTPRPAAAQVVAPDEGEVSAAGATTTVSHSTTTTHVVNAQASTAPIKLAQATPAKPTPAKKAHVTAADDDDQDTATTTVAKPKATTTATPTSASGAAFPVGGPSVVQIGAYSSSELSDKGFAEVSAAMAGKMGGKSKHVLALDHNGATLYRTWISGFASRADAVSFCEALRAKSRACFVKS